MTREEILKDPEVAHYCDAKRGWVHEAFMDGVDYSERKMKPQIKWHTGEPKDDGEYLVSLEDGSVCRDEWRKLYCDDDMKCWVYNEGEVKAWCKLSDIEPYNKKEEQP